MNYVNISASDSVILYNLTDFSPLCLILPLAQKELPHNNRSKVFPDLIISILSLAMQDYFPPIMCANTAL